MIFRKLLLCHYRIIPLQKYSYENSNELNTADPVIFYGLNPHEHAVYIPSSGLLEKNTAEFLIPEVSFKDDILTLFPEKHSHFGVDFDLFSAAFYLLSGYYFYFLNDYDQHLRYNEKNDFFIKNRIFQEPWVQVWTTLLAGMLKKVFPAFEYSPPQFSWNFTFDVDHPYAFLHKGIRSLAGFLKDSLTLNISNFSKRFQAFINSVDPYDTFQYISDFVPPDKGRFFFLIESLTRYDNYTSSQNKHYRRLIRGLAEQNYGIGIHPSYSTFLSPQAIKIEKEMLEEITEMEIKSARQHFLRYRLPFTPEYYLESEIIHDYNAVTVYEPGFRFGISIPFQWFNLQQNVMTPLIIFPTVVMDTTLKFYQNLSPEMAFQQINALVEKISITGGCFSMLWHNGSLSQIHGWQGYRELFESLIIKLKQLEN